MYMYRRQAADGDPRLGRGASAGRAAGIYI